MNKEHDRRVLLPPLLPPGKPFSMFPFCTIAEVEERYPISSMCEVLSSTDPAEDGRPSGMSFILQERTTLNVLVAEDTDLCSKYMKPTLHGVCEFCISTVQETGVARPKSACCVLTIRTENGRSSWHSPPQQRKGVAFSLAQKMLGRILCLFCISGFFFLSFFLFWVLFRSWSKKKKKRKMMPLTRQGATEHQAFQFHLSFHWGGGEDAIFNAALARSGIGADRGSGLTPPPNRWSRCSLLICYPSPPPAQCTAMTQRSTFNLGLCGQIFCQFFYLVSSAQVNCSRLCI